MKTSIILIFGGNMKSYKKELTPIMYSSSSIKILHYEIAPNKGCFRTHWHDRIELLRIKRGEIFVGYDTNIRKVKEGEVLLIPPRTPHKGFAGDMPLEYDVVMFDIRSFYNDTEICRTYFQAIYDGRAKFQTITKEREMIACLDKICEMERSFQSSIEVIAEIYRLISLLLKYSLLEIDYDIHTNQKMQEIVRYMEENCGQDLTTASLSEYFHYSEEHFCRKFKATTGLTPMKYLKIYRIEKAYQMIKDGERDVGRLAAICGFADANYFTRCFKAHFGMPPSYFMKKMDN